MMMTKLLFDQDDFKLIVNPRLAELLGLNEAVFLQQVHYWLGKNEQKERNNHAGRYWCYNSYEDWRKNNFPFWSVDAIRRIVKALVAAGVLLVDNHNKLKIDRTQWYSIDYQRLNDLWISHSAKSPHGHSKIAAPIPETTIETTETVNKEIVRMKIKRKGWVRCGKHWSPVLGPDGSPLSSDETVGLLATIKAHDSPFSIVDKRTGEMSDVPIKLVRQLIPLVPPELQSEPVA